VGLVDHLVDRVVELLRPWREVQLASVPEVLDVHLEKRVLDGFLAKLLLVLGKVFLLLALCEGIFGLAEYFDCEVDVAAGDHEVVEFDELEQLLVVGLLGGHLGELHLAVGVVAD